MHNATEHGTDRPVAPEGNKLSFFLTCVIAFLTPLFFIPLPQAPFQFSKTALVAIVVAVLVILFALRVFRTGALSFQWSLLIGASLLLPLLYFVSALFSTQPPVSFFGYQLETDTFGFILLAGMLVFTVTALKLSRERVFSVLMAFFAGAALAILFQAYQVFIGGPLGAALFGSPLANVVGSWNDFGILAGLMLIISLLAIEMMRLPGIAAIVAWGMLFVSLAFVALVGLPEVWWLVGVISFGVVLFTVSRGVFLKQQEHSTVSRRPFAAGIVLAISVIFVFFGGIIAPVQEALNVAEIEVRPSLQGTMAVFSGTFAENPIIGSGPGTFSSQWLIHRPVEVLQTLFWNVSFGTGSGTIPGAMAVGGIVVMIAWLFFLGTLAFTAVRALISAAGDERSLLVIALTSLGSVYLAVLHVLYAPGQAITILFFLFVALTVSALAGTQSVKSVSWSFKEAPRLGFIAIFISTVAIALSLGAAVQTGVAYTSSLYHSQAFIYADREEFDAALRVASRAVEIRPQDRYFRTMALIDFARLNAILAIEDPSEEEQEAFRVSLTRAIENAGRAINVNDRNFQNWLLRGALYGAVVPLNIQGAYDAAITTLERARSLNPNSPEIDLRLARAHVAAGNPEPAREAIQRALEKRPNYTDAILLRAQVELSSGNLTEAIDSLYAAVFFEPNNAVLLYQLGLLLIEDKSYADAVEALGAALRLEPQFADAAFFLAHAHAFLGESDRAIELLEHVYASNRDSELVRSYLDALRAGENPFEEGLVSPSEESELIEVE